MKRKRPWAILVLAIFFLLAPFFNLASSLYVGGSSRWLSPLVQFMLFQKLTLPEQALMISDILVAFLLYYQNKRSWVLAIILLSATTIYNIISFATRPSGGPFQILSLFDVFATCSLFVIIYFFRYPFIDKRDSVIAGPTKRSKVDIQAEIKDHGKCTVVDISKTGCKIVMATSKEASFKVGDEVSLRLTDSILVYCEVIHSFQGIGLKFKKPSRAAKQYLKAVAPDNVVS